MSKPTFEKLEKRVKELEESQEVKTGFKEDWEDFAAYYKEMFSECYSCE